MSMRKAAKLCSGMTLELTNQDSHVPLGRLPHPLVLHGRRMAIGRELLILVTAEILPGTTSDAL